MAEVLGDATIRVRPEFDNNSMTSGARSVGEKAGKEAGTGFNTGFKTLVTGAIGAITALAAGKVGEFFKDTINAASDVSESTNKIKVVFGKASDSVLQFGKDSAKTMGISQRTYTETVGTLGNLLVSLKLPQSEAAKMSTRMVELAGDMASFNNTTPEQALEAIRSGLVGETEPLRAFGVNMNDATLKAEAMKLGLIKTTKEALTPQQKAIASYHLILDQTGTAQGDFARTSSGMANTQRIMAAQWEDLKTKIGQQFLPIATKAFNYITNNIMPALDGFADGLKGVDDKAGGLTGKLNDVGESIRGFFDGITGKKNDLDGVAGTVTSIGSAIRDTGEWVKNNSDYILTALGAYAAYKTAIELIAGATKLWAFYQTLLDGALLANPIGLIVGVVVGFIAIWVLAYNKVKWFHDAVNWWFGHLYEVAKWWLQGWKDVINDAMPFLTWFGDGWTKTFGDAKNALSDFTSWFSGGWSKTFSDAKPPAEGFMNWFTSGWNQTFTDARATGTSWFSWFTTGWTGTFNDARTTGTSWFSWFTSGWSSTFTSARTTAQSWFSWFTSGWAGTLNDARSAGTTFFSWFVNGWAGIFNDVRSSASAFFNWFVNGWKNTLNDVSNAMSSAVNAIGQFWESLKAKTSAPVKWVVDVVINNGIIDTVNDVTKLLGHPTNWSHINPGFAHGGQIPGPWGTTRGDNIMAMTPFGMMGLQTGEYVMPVDKTRKYFSLLEAMRNGDPIKAPLGDRAKNGYADGGVIGDLISAMTDPFGSIKNAVSGKIGEIAGLEGGSPFISALTGMPERILSAVEQWIKDHLTDIFGGGAANLGGPGGDSVAAILATARKFYSGAMVSSGSRPGSVSATGNADYHSMGLAADLIGGGIPGMLQIAQGFYGISGRLLEEIHSNGPGYYVKNGARVGPEFYASELAGHHDHVHIAAYANALGFAGGGRIPEPIYGVGRSGRRYKFGERGSETVVPNEGFNVSYTFNVDGDVSERTAESIKKHVDGKLGELKTQLQTGRRK